MLVLRLELVFDIYKDGTPDRKSLSAVFLSVAIMHSEIVMLCHLAVHFERAMGDSCCYKPEIEEKGHFFVIITINLNSLSDLFPRILYKATACI